MMKKIKRKNQKNNQKCKRFLNNMIKIKLNKKKRLKKKKKKIEN